MMKHSYSVHLGLSLALLAAAALAGQSSSSYQIPTDVLSGGGNASGSASYLNDGTLGQSSPLGDATSTGYDNYPGFWQADWCLWDPDLDLLGNCAEETLLTDYTDPDTDADGLNDGAEVLTYTTDPLLPDTDGDGLNDGSEVNTYSSDPLLTDTDLDGANDGAEALTYGTDPIDPDTDADLMNDGYEIGEMPCLAPLVADGATDFDGDGQENVDEYFDSELHVADPCDNATPLRGKPAGGYFSDSDGSLSVGGPDLDALAALLMGIPINYSFVFPADPLVQDMDGSNSIGGPDYDIMAALLMGTQGDYIPGTPDTLAQLLPAGIPNVAVGSTVALKARLTQASGPLARPGFGVVFDVVSGSATILGGAGGPAAGYGLESRYDISDLNGEVRATLLVLAPGLIKVKVELPYDGDIHTMQVTLTPDITVNGTP